MKIRSRTTQRKGYAGKESGPADSYGIIRILIFIAVFVFFGWLYLTA